MKNRGLHTALRHACFVLPDLNSAVGDVAESQSMVRTIGVRKQQQKCFRGSGSKYCCIIYKTTTGSRSEANRCKQREGMRRMCAAAKQRQSSRRAFLELWQQSTSDKRARSSRFDTAEKFEKNGLCQNCTFGALQAWSLHFLWQFLLKTETQAINAQEAAILTPQKSSKKMAYAKTAHSVHCRPGACIFCGSSY